MCEGRSSIIHIIRSSTCAWLGVVRLILFCCSAALLRLSLSLSDCRFVVLYGSGRQLSARRKSSGGRTKRRSAGARQPASSFGVTLRSGFCLS